MPLPIVPFSAVAKGSIGKPVRCEHCGEDFVYIASRRAAGMGQSLLLLNNAGAKARAQRNADEQLAWDLSEAVEPAPCPHCGRLQKNMMRLARRRYQRWLTFLGGTVLFCGLVYFPVYLVGQSGGSDAVAKNWPVLPAWIAVGLGIVLLLVRWSMLRSYNPECQAEQARWIKRLANAIYTRAQWDEIHETVGPLTTHAQESERRHPAAKRGTADALSELAAARDEADGSS